MQPLPPYGGGTPSQSYGQNTPNGYPPNQPNGRRIWLGDIFALSGGLFVFLFSFAPFVKYPETVVSQAMQSGVNFDGWYMAWSPQMFMAPLSWLPIFAALGVAALAIVRMTTATDPEFLQFRAGRVQVGLALCALAVLFGYAVSQKQVGFGLDRYLTTSDAIIANNMSRPEFAWGGYLMLVGALAAAVGAMLNHFRVGHVQANLATREMPAATQQWPGNQPPPAQPMSPAGQIGYPAPRPNAQVTPQNGYPGPAVYSTDQQLGYQAGYSTDYQGQYPTGYQQGHRA